MSLSQIRRESSAARACSVPRRLWPLPVSLGVCALLAAHARAETTLTVDLSSILGPVTHAASGSLYGVTETLPADVNALIAPLRPNMFTNPAANVQQPVGDAILVAARVAPTGARVTIRLADWFKGFYTFTSMSDWFDKIGQTVTRRKTAGLTNVYAYEIWNEPSGTYSSSNPLPFNEFWRQTFAKLRQLDPEIKITGPSLSYYNESWLKDFLSFCKTNACLPDIVGWHELGGGNLTGTLQAYRTLEKQLGIGPLPISINEYSGAGRIDVEGQPGASAPLIAKFERFRVDTACISYWDVAHAGRLGSLLATNTEPNGGWWFYKWYGDMTGNMVSTTPPTPSSATALDGFANLDASGGSASVVFGGANDGTIKVIVGGFATAAVFGGRVHTVIERAPFVNRTTVVRATDTLSTGDLNVTNDQITVSITGANATAGYRLLLTPSGSSVGGSTSTGGTAGGGRSNDGGASNTGGSKASGGGTSIGGRNSGGTSATDITSGGRTSSTGGTRASAGGTSSTGMLATGGAEAGGASTDVRSTGGNRASGGSAGSVASSDASGGLPATGGNFSGGREAFAGSSTALSSAASVASSAGGNSGMGVTSSSESNTEASGCNCRTAQRQNNGYCGAVLAGLLLLVGAARKRRVVPIRARATQIAVCCAPERVALPSPGSSAWLWFRENSRALRLPR